MADSHGRASFRQSLTDALATADLRRLQLNWTGASVGSWTFFIVLAVYAYNQGGATAVGVAALARMVPAGLAAPLAGVVVDRRSRREVLLASTIGRAALGRHRRGGGRRGAARGRARAQRGVYGARDGPQAGSGCALARARGDAAADSGIERGSHRRGQRRLSRGLAARRRPGSIHQHRARVPGHRRVFRSRRLAA